MALAPTQREAIELAIRSRVLVITGGPGTGKTTLVRGILAAVAEDGLRIALAAPTGRAARRLAESTGREARTLHRLLEADPERGFRRNRGRPLEAELVIVDEASMIDTQLMAALLDALPTTAALLLVGDVDQLPSIGPGQVLADVIGSGARAGGPADRDLPPGGRERDRAQRAPDQPRRAAGLRPRRGRPGDCYGIRVTGPEDTEAKLLDLILHRIPERFGLDPVNDVQVLTPVNRGRSGTQALNELLQAHLNPDPPLALTRGHGRLALGDKVMQLENDYDREVYNGDVGRITAHRPARADARGHHGRAPAELCRRRAGPPRRRLRGHRPQGARLGIPGGRAAAPAPARSHAAPQPALYRHHPRAAAGRPAHRARGPGARGARHQRPAPHHPAPPPPQATRNDRHDPARTRRPAGRRHAHRPRGRALALDYFRNRAELAIEHKGQQDLVSIADRNVEELLRERLAAAFPGDAVLGEEGGGGDGAARTWVLDPIDGTFNFLKGIPCWGVVAALVVDGRIEIGLTYDPVHDEMFTARRGGGTFRNGAPVRVSGNQGVDTSCLAVAYSFRQPREAYVAHGRRGAAPRLRASPLRLDRDPALLGRRRPLRRVRHPATARPGTASPA